MLAGDNYLQRETRVTLTICTHNGRNNLEKTLEHILAQKVSHNLSWELLIIDNASTDGTVEFIKEFWSCDRTHQLRILREETLGVIHARNRAIKEARYSYLSYIDDDNWISSNWVTEVYRIFETYPNVGIISCPSTANLSETPPTYFENLKGWLAVGTRCVNEGIVTQRPFSFWTAGLSLRLEAFQPLSKTNYSVCLTGRTGKETYGGEDHELCLTLTLMGWDIYFNHQISFVHDLHPNRLTVSYLERLIHNGGKSRAILDIYRNEFWKRIFYNPYLSILEYFFVFANRALRYWIKRLLGSATAPLHPNRISYLHAMGRVKSYFIHFSRISQAKRNIRILKILNSTSS